MDRFQHLLPRGRKGDAELDLGFGNLCIAQARLKNAIGEAPHPRDELTRAIGGCRFAMSGLV
jgi:hypothetical protein